MYFCGTSQSQLSTFDLLGHLTSSHKRSILIWPFAPFGFWKNKETSEHELTFSMSLHVIDQAISLTPCAGKCYWNRTKPEKKPFYSQLQNGDTVNSGLFIHLKCQCLQFSLKCGDFMNASSFFCGFPAVWSQHGRNIFSFVMMSLPISWSTACPPGGHWLVDVCPGWECLYFRSVLRLCTLVWQQFGSRFSRLCVCDHTEALIWVPSDGLNVVLNLFAVACGGSVESFWAEICCVLQKTDDHMSVLSIVRDLWWSRTLRWQLNSM